MPVKNMGTALELYQPSSAKGVMLKKVLPVITQIPLVGMMFERLMNIVECEMIIPYEVEKVIYDLFGKKELTLSYFSGTPSVHQKEIIQIASKKGILGYIKYSNAYEVKKIFEIEARLLDYLHQVGFEYCPKCLYFSKANELGIFAQDTKKKRNSVSPHVLSKYHIQFLEELYDRTRIVINYKETDYYKDILNLTKLKNSLSYLKERQDAIDRAIIMVVDDISKRKEFGFYHGDFTPWNTCVVDNHLFAFDFEYAKKTYPAYIDVFHFFTQTLIWKKGYRSNSIIKEFEKMFIKGIYGYIFNDAKVAYLEYLLSVICQFATRDGMNLKPDDFQNMIIWIDIVDELVLCKS